ncbi:DUF2267 domain-containing protein [Streptomyces griseoluteus]|uniref:DUF2267 domain-containing protein n=1 Tax=Streptomyces griseoluteus TaxID=29306 RepID=UPI00343AE267
MDYETFIGTVSRRSRVPREAATALTRATLETLAERLTGREADALAARLPKPLRASLAAPAPEAEGFGLDEFVDRVSRRSGLSPAEARRGVPAELSTLHDAVHDDEFRPVPAQRRTGFGERVEARD